jgi:putative nucleotidyltransferase with HDIG domain
MGMGGAPACRQPGSGRLRALIPLHFRPLGGINCFKMRPIDSDILSLSCGFLNFSRVLKLCPGPMKNQDALPWIDVSALQVGMFIHLDMSWMAHPFALSSFRLAHRDQIESIGQLGLRRVRWNPQLSSAPWNGEPAAGVGAPLTQDRPFTLDALPTPLDPDQQARVALARQREQHTLCERQFAQVCEEHQGVCSLATQEAERAGQQATSLAQSLVDKLQASPEVGIRLLSEAAGGGVASHGVNVGLLALLMGRMFGWKGQDLVDLCLGAMFHDIGKLEMAPQHRHLAPGAPAADRQAYQEHVSRGLALAQRMGLSPQALLVIGQHHERTDGKGFPLQVRAERLSASSRLVALLNHYDKLCNAPDPAHSLTPHEALSLLFSEGAEKFDTSILANFIKMMGVYPLGSVVQLTDDRYALVVGVNASRPIRPQVQIFDPRLTWKSELTVDLEQASGLGIRRAVKPAHLPDAARQFLMPRTRVQYFFEPLPGAARAAA